MLVEFFLGGGDMRTVYVGAKIIVIALLTLSFERVCLAGEELKLQSGSNNYQSQEVIKLAEDFLMFTNSGNFDYKPYSD